MNNCVLWTKGRSTHGGYGVTNRRGEGSAGWIYAHRYAWEQANGPIAPGMHIHHKCHVPACINIKHLELVSTAEHAARHRKTHCRHGHPYSGTQVVTINKRTYTRQVCHMCWVKNSQRYQRKQRQAGSVPKRQRRAS
jgi:hypothetical protein